MTVIDSRVISILARRAPQVTVVQAQNICTDLSEQGLLPGLKFNDAPPVDNNLYVLRNKFIEETSTSPEDEPDKEEIERLTEEARKQRPKAVEGFTIESAAREIQRLQKYEEYVLESGFILGFKQWLVTKPKSNPFT